MTEAEQKLWSSLKNKQFAKLKFRRQAAIAKYIVDFVCFENRLIIEVDGGQHNEPNQRHYDATRTEFLQSQGFHVLRFWNFEVLEETDVVIEAIEKKVGEITSDASPHP